MIRVTVHGVPTEMRVEAVLKDICCAVAMADMRGAVKEENVHAHYSDKPPDAVVGRNIVAIVEGLEEGWSRENKEQLIPMVGFILRRHFSILYTVACHIVRPVSGVELSGVWAPKLIRV